MSKLFSLYALAYIVSMLLYMAYPPLQSDNAVVILAGGLGHALGMIIIPSALALVLRLLKKPWVITFTASYLIILGINLYGLTL